MIVSAVTGLALGILMWFVSCMVVEYIDGRTWKKVYKKDVLMNRGRIAAVFTFVMLGLIYSLVFFHYGYYMTKIVRYLMLIFAVLTIAYIDWKKRIIPNVVLAGLLIFRTIWLIVEIFIYSYATVDILLGSFGGLVIGVLLFLIAYFVSRKGIGLGDVKFVGVIGYFTGISVLYGILVISLFLIVCYSMVQLLRKKVTWKDSIAFGPFLAVGTIFALLAGI